eukprot:Gregarina_sp_Poly_1__2253@NODE_15_length_23029_cov_81_474305_g13_i0_p26_GENE_NODE_15_length_23029_cov_81_474305_g13_i0NODE_15_length_23029_cov_81_474305_g13_i0_p26_ORF_typecomplete_len104_score9_52_NODE_15_length_23029_cov_81_474305_g13_i01442314734
MALSLRGNRCLGPQILTGLGSFSVRQAPVGYDLQTRWRTPMSTQTDAPKDKIVNDKLRVAYPDVPLDYYRANKDSIHSIQHRMFYINWLAVAAAIEVLREIID